jgi:hypothetical protein
VSGRHPRPRTVRRQVERAARKRGRVLERRPASLRPQVPAPLTAATGRALAAKLTGILEDPAADTLVGWGVTAYRHAVRVDVPPELCRGLVVGAGMPGNCFEVAMLYVLRHADQPVTLTHGVIIDQGWPVSHGWVELPDNAVFDPSTGRFYVASSFHRVLQALPLCVYTPAEAIARMTATGRAGPWERYTGRLANLVQAWQDHLEAETPGLGEWVEQMYHADPGFRRDCDQAVARSGLAVVHILAELAAHPDRWRLHPPGRAPWPHVVDPLDHTYDHPNTSRRDPKWA